MIAFLHTSPIHIKRFDDLLAKHAPNLEVEHFVNEELLKIALKEGRVSSKLFQNQVDLIKATEPELIICTCSTYGEECDKTNNIQRIDSPIVLHLVTNYQRIGIAYTALSTKEVSMNLLRKTAKALNKNIEIVDCNCSEFWRDFESGNLEVYAKNIADKIRGFEPKVDVIFLAQASMERAKEHLQDFNKKVFSSPEFGIVECLKNHLSMGKS